MLYNGLYLYIYTMYKYTMDRYILQGTSMMYIVQGTSTRIVHKVRVLFILYYVHRTRYIVHLWSTRAASATAKGKKRRVLSRAATALGARVLLYTYQVPRTSCTSSSTTYRYRTVDRALSLGVSPTPASLPTRTEIHAHTRAHAGRRRRTRAHTHTQARTRAHTHA